MSFDKFGGKDAYAKSQQNRYSQALSSGNTDLVNRLKADSKRVGYSLGNNPVNSNPNRTPLTSGGTVTRSGNAGFGDMVKNTSQLGNRNGLRTDQPINSHINKGKRTGTGQGLSHNPISNNSTTTPRPESNYQIETYNPNSQVEDSYIRQAMNKSVYANKGELYDGYAGGYIKASQALNQDQIREMAYYLQLQDQYSGSLENYQQQEVAKGKGLSHDWATNYTDLQDNYRKSWAVQDFLADKYNLNGMNDTMIKGISRDDLGFNVGGNATPMEEYNTAQWLEKNYGLSHQQATDMAQGRNGFNKFIVQDNKLIDTGEQQQSDPWGAIGEYFNDPRHKDKQFEWMNYINPTALEGQRDYDGRSIDYYYNTNFARDNGYINDNETNWNFNAPAPWDWRNMSHEDVVNTYGRGSDFYNQLMESKAGKPSYYDVLRSVIDRLE